MICQKWNQSTCLWSIEITEINDRFFSRSRKKKLFDVIFLSMFQVGNRSREMSFSPEFPFERQGNLVFTEKIFVRWKSDSNRRENSFFPARIGEKTKILFEFRPTNQSSQNRRAKTSPKQSDPKKFAEIQRQKSAGKFSAQTKTKNHFRPFSFHFSDEPNDELVNSIDDSRAFRKKAFYFFCQ